MRAHENLAAILASSLTTLGVAGCCGQDSPKSAANWRAAAQASPAKKIGVLDQADAQSIRGWAWDPRRANEPVRVDVFDGDKLIATLEADQYREDLEAEGLGEGSHQFEMKPPVGLADGTPHAIHVRYAGTPHDLTSSPRTMMSFGDEKEQSPTPPVTTAGPVKAPAVAPPAP